MRRLAAAAEILAKRFGVEMSKGYTYRSGNTADKESASPSVIVYSRENKLLADTRSRMGASEDGAGQSRACVLPASRSKARKAAIAFLKLADTRRR